MAWAAGLSFERCAVMIKDQSSQLHPTLGIPWSKMPRHVAIIMDGNGRWAQKRGLPRIEGHRNGSKGVRFTITEAAQLGIECLTLYSFSTENWKRPPEEVAGLMKLYEKYLIEERPTIMNNNIVVRHLGDEQALPSNVLDQLQETVRLSQANTGMTLCLALNYSGRSELITAIKKIARDCKDGALDEADISEALLSATLDTAGLPDPDLLIRTAGEMRISNFLLWQISYAELYVTDVYWPDFNQGVMRQAIKDYAQRNRRFGGLSPAQR
jgi:undecaprenyl diphosphate synthase